MLRLKQEKILRWMDIEFLKNCILSYCLPDHIRKPTSVSNKGKDYRSCKICEWRNKWGCQNAYKFPRTNNSEGYKQWKN